MNYQCTFVECTSDHTISSKQWKHDIENKRDLARNHLITGGNQMLELNNEIGSEPVAIVESSAQPKDTVNLIPTVIATRMTTITTQLAIANEFTLNTEQKFAFMIITGHLNGENRFCAGIIE